MRSACGTPAEGISRQIFVSMNWICCFKQLTLRQPPVDVMIISVYQSFRTRLFGKMGSHFRKIFECSKRSSIVWRTYDSSDFCLVCDCVPHANPYLNAGCMAENITLAATALGLGSVLLAAPVRALLQCSQLLAQLELREQFQPAIAVAVGYQSSEAIHKP